MNAQMEKTNWHLPEWALEVQCGELVIEGGAIRILGWSACPRKLRRQKLTDNKSSVKLKRSVF
jgi:hypothetical protein